MKKDLREVYWASNLAVAEAAVDASAEPSTAERSNASPRTRNAVLFATSNEKPAGITLPTLNGPTISVTANPGNPETKLLLVMGRTPEEAYFVKWDEETQAECKAMAQVLDRVGDKWTVMVVGVLSGGPQRFNTILRDHPHYHPLGAFLDGKLVALAGLWIATKVSHV